LWIKEMAEKKFWHLDGPESQRKLAKWDSDQMELESIKYPVNANHQHPGRRLTNLSLKLPGGTVEDLVWTWYSECLIQDHVLHVLKAKGFSGFEVKPAMARFAKGEDKRPPRLWELIVTGWAGLAPPESGIKLLEHCQACHHFRYFGLTHPEKVLDVSKWDGSDFFIVWPLPNFRFITERVRQTIQEERWQGVRLQKQQDLQTSGTGFSPGRLSYSMPDSRARQLGEPLGIY
jgi:hypothetical protein